MRFSLPLFSCLLLLSAQTVLAQNQVLILHSAHTPSYWTTTLGKELKTALQDAAEVHTIYLKTTGDDEDAFDTLFDQLAQQLDKTHFATVVADGETAFAFARKYGDSLFPQTPLVYCSLDQQDATILNQCSHCTGVAMELAIKRSVDLIFFMLPRTRLVVVIADGSPKTKPLMEQVKQAMTPYMDRAQIMFPGFEEGDDGGLDMLQLGRTLSSVPAAGVVLFLGFSQDKKGIPVSKQSIGSLFEKRCTAPVFMLKNAWPEAGMLGGWLITPNDVGRNVAAVVKRILKGEPAQEMLPEPIRPRLCFDGTALARFNLKPPKGAQVYNDPAKTVATPSALPVSGLAWCFGLAVFGLLLFLLRRYRA